MTRLNSNRVQPPTARVWRLYRFYDSAGVLLYIGQTCRPLARLIEHLEEQGWAGEIASWAVDPRSWLSEAEVLAVEEAAIRAERPRYNWQHNEGPHRVWVPKVRSYRHPGRRPAARPATARRLWRSRWTRPVAVWAALAAWIVWLVVGVAGRGLSLETALWSAVAAQVLLAWWRWHGRSWLWRRWRRWRR